MAIETDRLIAADPASPQEEALERALRPKSLAEYVGQEKIRGQLSIFHRGRRASAGSARPRAAVRAAGPGQDDARAHHRARDGREPAPDLGSGARAPGRPGGDPHQPRAERRAVHRRDPPAVAGGRGDPLPGAGGLPDRHHDRRGAGGALGQARPAAVHAGRRHDARRHAHQSAARPLRHRRAARVLFRRRAVPDRQPLRPAARCRDLPEGAMEIARRARGTPRIANRLLRRVRDFAQVRARATSRARSPTRRSSCSMSMCSAWTSWTASCCSR